MTSRASADPTAVDSLGDDLRADLGALGLTGVESATPLRGGRGGRTWQIRASHGAYVLHRRAIDDGAGRVRREQRCTALAHGVGVGPQPVARDDERGLLLTRWIPGRAMTTTGVHHAESLDRIAEALRQLHTAPLPRHRVRPTRDRARYVSRLLARRDVGEPWAEVIAATNNELTALAEHLDASVPHEVLVHGDVVPGNVILSRQRTSLVDFEYAGRGDPAFDLGNAAASAGLDADATDHLVTSYLSRASAQERRMWQRRVRAWSRVAQGGWIAWVAASDDLGPQTTRWRRWADAAADDLQRAHRSGAITKLLHQLSDAV
jgi:thiamine kinase-like enzyme